MINVTVAALTQIGQYKIVRTLGTGGMGTVYLGEHVLLGRRAAIKTLLPRLSSHREIVDRFFNEARAISAISDPGVVQIFDFGYHVDGTAYIVMEYLEGESLAARLDRLAKLPAVEALRLTRQIAASLSAAHARGIIHRDLKPGNVFVIRDPEAAGGERTKILDFGVAKLVADPTELVATQTGTMLGTPVYMSPEQCRGTGKIDDRSDIYSVGCALFHMLTGVPPFDCDSVGDFIAAHLKEEPPRPSELAPDLPPEIDALVLRCLAKRPEDRFQTMTELGAAIEDVLATIGDVNRIPESAPMSATPLGEGFKSAYDVNQTAQLRTRTPPAARSWFVEELTPVSASSIEDDEHEWLPPEKGLSAFQRIALVGALFTGLIGGLIVTSYLVEGEDDTVSVPALNVPAGVDVTSPVVATANEPVVAEPPPEPEPEPEPTEEPDRPVVEKVVTPPKKPARPHPARTPPRPRPRRPSPPAPAAEPQQPTSEDLYDTR